MFTLFIGIQDWQWLGNCLHLAPQNWTLDREVAHVSIGSSPSSETFLRLNLFIGTHPSNSWTPGHSVYIQIHSINMFSFCLTLPGLDITCCITCSTLQVRHHFAPVVPSPIIQWEYPQNSYGTDKHWRYRFHNKAFFQGLNFREYPHKNMVLYGTNVPPI